MFMPIVKKNYTIYGDPAKNPSDKGDGRNSRKISQVSVTSSGPGSRPGSRKKVRSEGVSLSTSTGAQGEVIIHRIPIPQRNNSGSGPPLSRSLPIRARGSEPILRSVPPPFLRNNSLPEGSKSVASIVPVSPTHSTSSTSTSSSEGHQPHRFHIKLLNRLKKSFRIKDSAPAPS